MNAKTQAQVACEIGLPNFIIANDKHINLNKAKALADLLEGISTLCLLQFQSYFEISTFFLICSLYRSDVR